MEEAQGGSGENRAVFEEARREDGYRRPFEFVVSKEDEAEDSAEEEDPDLG
jgi:hypothetical protein